MVVEYTYDVWGKVMSRTGSLASSIGIINPIRYRGYYYDTETGFYYCQSRYYDPEICRWINADGYISTGQGIISFNMFVYCLNNPVNYLDPYGRACICLTRRVRGNHICKNQEDEPFVLYDSDRLFPDRLFREQIIVVDHGAGLNFDDENIEVGANVDFTLYANGWETEDCDLSLFDFGKVEAGIGLFTDYLGVEAVATVWAPTIEFNIKGYSISLGLNVLSYGVQAAYKKGQFEAGIGWGIWGFSGSVSKNK